MPVYNVVARIWTAMPAPLRKVYYRISTSHFLASKCLPDKLEIVDIQGGIAKGMRMQLNLRRERGYYFGTHELDVQSILSKIVRPGMKVYNIGAHIGFFVLILNKLVGSEGMVISFEPNPEVRKRLLEHLSLNNLNGQVRVEEYALSDFDGNARFSLSLSNTQGRFEDLPYAKGGPIINVQCERLDKCVEENGCIPDFILMDVEHAEGRVLRGMSKTMETYRPLIVLETHGPEAIEETWVELKKHQYELATIPDLRVVASSDMVRYGHYLAAHRSYFEQNL